MAPAFTASVSRAAYRGTAMIRGAAMMNSAARNSERRSGKDIGFSHGIAETFHRLAELLRHIHPKAADRSAYREHDMPVAFATQTTGGQQRQRIGRVGIGITHPGPVNQHRMI